MRRVLAIMLVMGALAACSKSSNGYGRGTEAAFMETCTVHEQQPQAVCACIYEEITQQVPYDRYVELDKQMQTDDKFVPDELVRIASDCATRLTTTTTTSTSMVPPPTSSEGSSSTSSSSSSSSSSSVVNPLGL